MSTKSTVAIAQKLRVSICRNQELLRTSTTSTGGLRHFVACSSHMSTEQVAIFRGRPKSSVRRKVRKIGAGHDDGGDVEGIDSSPIAVRTTAQMIQARRRERALGGARIHVQHMLVRWKHVESDQVRPARKGYNPVLYTSDVKLRKAHGARVVLFNHRYRG